MHSQLTTENPLLNARDAVKRLGELYHKRPLSDQDIQQISTLFNHKQLTAGQLGDWTSRAMSGASIWLENLVPLPTKIDGLELPAMMGHVGVVNPNRRSLVQPNSSLDYVKLAVDSLGWCADEDATVKQGDYLNNEGLKLSKMALQRGLNSLALEILGQLIRADTIVEERFPVLQRLGASIMRDALANARQESVEQIT